jgi:hypothetical protein
MEGSSSVGAVEPRVVVFRLHQKCTIVTSSMDPCAVSLDARAVEDSWCRWSAVGRHQDQAAAAVVASRAAVAKDDDASLKAGAAAPCLGEGERYCHNGEGERRRL